MAFTKKKTSSQVHRKLENFLASSWWVLIFILFCYFGYEQGLRKHYTDYDKLHHQYLELQKEKAMLSAKQEQLVLQINSQSDPEWIELVLMKGLGLVPENQTKVVYK